MINVGDIVRDNLLAEAHSKAPLCVVMQIYNSNSNSGVAVRLKPLNPALLQDIKGIYGNDKTVPGVWTYVRDGSSVEFVERRC